MRPEATIAHEVRKLLKEAGFVLARTNRHFIYKRESDGATLTVSVSPKNVDHQINHVRQGIERCNRRGNRGAA